MKVLHKDSNNLKVTFAIVEVSKDTIEKFEEKRYEYEIYSIYLTFLHSAMFTNYLISINLAHIN